MFVFSWLFVISLFQKVISFKMKGTAQFEDFSVWYLSDLLSLFCSQYTCSRFLLDFFFLCSYGWILDQYYSTEMWLSQSLVLIILLNWYTMHLLDDSHRSSLQCIIPWVNCHLWCCCGVYQGQDYMCIQIIIPFVMLWYLIWDFLSLTRRLCYVVVPNMRFLSLTRRLYFP